MRLRSGAAAGAILAVCLAATGTPAQDVAVDRTGPVDPALRTFTLEKPRDLVEAQRRALEPPRDPITLPRTHDRLRTTIGVGYVQGADWGTELMAAGDAHGLQVQSSTLLTMGRRGVLWDSGIVSVFDPDRRWRIEGGDLFSYLRGASRGARISWAAGDRRRPALAVYGSRWARDTRRPVIAYRDQPIARERAIVEFEAASDRSYQGRMRLAPGPFELEAAYRSSRSPVTGTDASLFAGVTIWRGVSVSAGALRSEEGGRRTLWRTAAVHVPVARGLTLSLEQTAAGADGADDSSLALMINGGLGNVRFFHRHQFGEHERELFGASHAVQRQETQSMAAAAMRGVQLALQLATHRSESGAVQHWEELQASIAVTRRTAVRLVASVPDLGNAQRLRAHLRQELPRDFALHADYGRLSAFQDVPFELDRPRLKLMLFRSWNLATPARGGEVRGRVLDHTGRPVRGARVRLGSYSAETDASGAYLFRRVPRGVYALTLDARYVPADYAWDGRTLDLNVSPFSRLEVDLLVAPLNAIHGRVFVDRNRNGRFDDGEGLPRAVVRLGDRVTATDGAGAFSFYNVLPGRHVVRLDTALLPSDVAPPAADALPVTLGDDRPATGLEFRLGPKEKPIMLRGPLR